MNRRDASKPGRNSVLRPSIRNRNKSLKSNAKLHLQYEQLEKRYLLAGEILQDSSSVNVRPEWFANFTDVQRVPLLAPGEISAASQFRASNIPGPAALETEEWIVQLKDEAAESVTDIRNADILLDVPSVQFSIVRGLGKPGMLLVNARAVTSNDIRTALSDNTNVASFSFNNRVTSTALPNDPDFVSGLMYGLNNVGQFGGLIDADIDAPEAWDITTGTSNVVVGVIDSGIDAAHPDLYLNIWLNQGEIPHTRLQALRGADTLDIDGDELITFYDLNNLANATLVQDLNQSGYIDAFDLLADPIWAQGQDDDGNGFIDDFYGVNFRAGFAGEKFGVTNPTDTLGHGTHIAGTIGAIGNNGLGTTGVNWRTSLMSLKFLDENDVGDLAGAIGAINYATMMREEYNTNVRVLNNSWGQPGGFSADLENAIRQSSDAGIMFVAAAGNGNLLGEGVNNDRTPFYPASYDVNNVISVAASDYRDNLASFSNYGQVSVDLAAPGVGIRSTLPGRTENGKYFPGAFGNANGTSMATPHVAGAIALLSAAYPGATISELRQALFSKTDSMETTSQARVAKGRLNVKAAFDSETFSPAALLVNAPAITQPTDSSYQFTVKYVHPDGIDLATIGDNDLVIMNEWGSPKTFTARANRDSIQASSDSAVVTYEMTPPDGTWDVFDFGNYRVTLNPNTIATQRTQIPNISRDIGLFRVQIESPRTLYVSDREDGTVNDSLRRAISIANANPSAQYTIILDKATYTLDATPVADDQQVYASNMYSNCFAEDGNWSTPESGDLDISGQVLIHGSLSSHTTINANFIDRAFKVHPGGSLSLNNLTIENGKVAGIGAAGGGILAMGDLTLKQIVIRGSQASDNLPGLDTHGGALAIWHGNTDISQSQLIDNSGDIGGAIYACGSSTLNISQSTLARNHGGAVYSLSTHAFQIDNSTISANEGADTAVHYGVPNGQDGETNVPSLSPDGRYISFYSRATNFVPFTPGRFPPSSLLYLYDSANNSITLESKLNSGQALFDAGNFYSDSPALSENARYLAFGSFDSSGIFGRATPPSDVGLIYLRDRYANELTTPLVPAFGFTQFKNPSITPNGNHLLFKSNAPGFLFDTANNSRITVAPGVELTDDAGLVLFQSGNNVSLFDTQTRNSQIVSPRFQSNANDQPIASASMDAKAQLIAFSTSDSNFIADDLSQNSDVYTYDKDLKSLEIITRAFDGGDSDGDSINPQVSSDGRLVAFFSNATNLLSEPQPAEYALYIYDRLDKSLNRIDSKIPSDVEPRLSTSSFDSASKQLVFRSSRLVNGVELGGISIVNLETFESREVTLPVAQNQKAIIRSSTLAFNVTNQVTVSGDLSINNSLIVDNTSPTQIATTVTTSLFNMVRGQTGGSIVEPLSTNQSGTLINELSANSSALAAGDPTFRDTVDQLGNPRSRGDLGAVEANGGFVSGLALADINQNGIRETNDVALPNLPGRIIDLGLNTFDFQTQRDDLSTTLVDESGRISLSNVPAGDYSATLDAPPGWNFAPSKPVQLTGNDGNASNNSTSISAVSYTGQYSAFTSQATNLTSDLASDSSFNKVYLRDHYTGTVALVSKGFDGSSANNDSSLARITSDGRFVFFLSKATNLVDGETGNGLQNIFVFDRKTNQTTQAIPYFGSSGPEIAITSYAVSSDGSVLVFSGVIRRGDNVFFGLLRVNRTNDEITEVYYPDSPSVYSLSANGRYVLALNSSSDVEVFDAQQGLIDLVIKNLGGTGAPPIINNDGSRIFFNTGKIFSTTDKIAISQDAYLFNRESNTFKQITQPISKLQDPSNFRKSTFPVSLSDDGRFLLLVSDLPDLVKGDNNNSRDVFLYDTVNDSLMEVVSQITGTLPDFGSVSARISGDGHFIYLTSPSDNIVDNDSNGFSDLFVIENPLLPPSRVFTVTTAGKVQMDNWRLYPQNASVSGIVFQDAVPNEIYDDGEPLFSEAVVYVDMNKNGLLDPAEPTALTVNGAYTISEIGSERDIVLRVQPIKGFGQVTFENNNSGRSVFLSAGSNLQGQDFGFTRDTNIGQSQSSLVTGNVRLQTKSGQVPLPGTTVFLDRNGDRTRQDTEPQALTVADGSYQFDGLGQYTGDIVPLLDQTYKLVSPTGNSFEPLEIPLLPPELITSFTSVQAIAVGRFDEDEMPDLAIVLSESNQLVIRKGTADGSFSSTPLLINLPGQGAIPLSIVTADFDGDLRDEIAVANYGNGSVSILSNFDGSQFSIASITVGDLPLDIVAGKIDDNSSQDLVVLTQSRPGVNATIRALLNDGQGHFDLTSPNTLPAGLYSAIATGMFNLDQLADIVVVGDGAKTASPGTVSLYTGVGNGSFELQSTRTVGIRPRDIIATDFNGDALADVAISNFGDNTLSIFAVSDTQTLVPITTLGTSAGALDLVSADLELDGDTDVIVANLTDTNLSIFRNRFAQTGQLDFEPGKNIGVAAFSFSQRMPLAVVDSELTGLPDIVTIPSKDRSIHVLKNALVGGSHRLTLTGANSVVGLDFVIEPTVLAPSFNPIDAPLPLLEDASEQRLIISGIARGRPGNESLRFSVVASNPSLISLGTSPISFASGSTTGELKYSLNRDVSGTSVITITLTDPGFDETIDTVDDGIFKRSFTVNALSVNDPPSFNLPSERTLRVDEDSSAQSIAGFVTDISPGGGLTETNQLLSDFVVTPQNPSLFSELPAIDSQGRLTFAPKPDMVGSTSVTVTLKDNGGIENAGNNTRTDVFVLNIDPVNDAPRISILGNQTSTAGTGAQSVASFANEFIPGGGTDESNQTITDFVVSNDNPGIFLIQPSITTTGTLLFTPALDRTGIANVTVQVRDNGGTANNGIDLSNVESFVIAVLAVPDTIAPRPILSTAKSPLVDQQSFDVTIDFAEPVTGFGASQLIVSGGSKSNFQSISASRYQLTVTTNQDGTVTIDVPANAAQDIAGNASLTAAQLALRVDTQAPKPTLISVPALGASTRLNAWTMNVDFGEPVVGFTQADLSTVNASISDFVNVDGLSEKYSFTLTATNEGLVSAFIPASVVRDLAGNLNQASEKISRVFDQTSPNPVLNSNIAAATNLHNIPIDVDFGETVIDFNVSSVTVTGGTATNVQAVGLGRFTFLVQAPADGQVSVRILADKVHDEASNANSISNTLEFIIDSVGLRPILSTSEPRIINQGGFSVTAIFGGPITGFDIADVTVINGTASNLQLIDAPSGRFSFDITSDPSNDGTVTVLIPFGLSVDTFGNFSYVSNTLSLVVDRSQPTVTLSPALPNLINQRSFTVQVDFSEPVTGFDLSDLSLTHGTLSAFQQLSPSRYAFLFTAENDGPVTIGLSAGQAQDAAGNANTAAITLQTTFDGTPPLPSLTSLQTNPVASRDLNATVDFSEAVTGFDASDVFVVNGTLQSITTISSQKYDLQFKAAGDGIVVVGLVTGGAQDTAGNNSAGTIPLTFNVDQGSATYTPALSSNEITPTINRDFDVTIQFGRTITGLLSDAFSLTNLSVTDIHELSPGSYRIAVRVVNEGDYSISLPANKVLDVQNRNNNASNVLTGNFVDITNTDFGDAPNATQSGFSVSYPTRFSDNGARHKVTSLFLGAGVDAETDGQPSATATGDEATGSANDGISFLVTPIASSRGATFSLLQVNASGNGKLDGWIDLNLDGDWNDAGEQIVTNQSVTIGNQLVFYTIPVGASPGVTFARFRLSTAGGLSPIGPATDGEVEDYRLALLDGTAGANVRIDATTMGNASIDVTSDEVRIHQGNTSYFRGAVGDVAKIEVQSQGNTLLSVTDPGANLPGTIDYVTTNGTIDATLQVTQGSFDLGSPAGRSLVGIDKIDLTATKTSLNITATDVNRFTGEGSKVLRIVTDGNDSFTAEAGWKYTTAIKENDRFVPTFQNGIAQVEIVTSPEWHNPFNELDANGDGSVTTLDALLVINALNGSRVMDGQGVFFGANQLDVLDFQFYDTDGDGKLAPLDALIVINELNRRTSGEPTDPLWRDDRRDRSSQDEEELIDEVMACWPEP